MKRISAGSSKLRKKLGILQGVLRESKRCSSR